MKSYRESLDVITELNIVTIAESEFKVKQLASLMAICAHKKVDTQ